MRPVCRDRGHLVDSAHDPDPAIYAEVACTGRVFIDFRGVRAEQLEILRLATSDALWPNYEFAGQAVPSLAKRYGVDVVDLGAMPTWVLANALPQGPPSPGVTLDLDALLTRLNLRSKQARAQ